MAALFSTYESDFELALQEANSKLTQAVNSSAGDRKLILKATEALTDECYELIEQMELEVQSIPSNERSSYNGAIRKYKGELEQSKGKLTQLLDEQDSYDLFGSRTDTNFGSYSDDVPNQQRKQLLTNHSILERTSDKLRDSQRVALETENIGSNILNDLRSQREQITNSRNTLMNADSYIDRSVQTLRSMSRRLTANKFISYAIIAVLIILIFLVLASKFH